MEHLSTFFYREGRNTAQEIHPTKFRTNGAAAERVSQNELASIIAPT